MIDISKNKNFMKKLHNQSWEPKTAKEIIKDLKRAVKHYYPEECIKRYLNGQS